LSATITTPAQITVMDIRKIAANINASLFMAGNPLLSGYIMDPSLVPLQ